MRIESRHLSSTPAQLSKDQGKVELVPSKPARTRFAPSPTGYLHLGSLRTALFNYLLAKKTGGQFLLRIEDTDQKRLVPDAEQRLCEDLKWAGLQWDEGPEVGGPYGPYKQSERTELYQKHANELLENGTAFRCFCSTKPPTTVEADPSRIGVSLGGCQEDCASVPAEQSNARAEQGDRYAVRFRKPAFAPKWTDLVYGKISLGDKNVKKKLPQTASIDGVILLKGDGTPTYHLANVVDDHYMEITHVIRGSEWMSSTPLHVALYDAFKWEPPAFAHVGLLTDEEQNKLSKRNFDTDVRALRDKSGILPESLVNFLALLGWRNPGRDDVMDLGQLTEAFDLKFTRGNTMVTLDKLWYLQKHHAAKRVSQGTEPRDGPDPALSQLVDLVAKAAESVYSSEVLGRRGLIPYVAAVLAVDRNNYDKPESFVKRNDYFFTTQTGDQAVANASSSNIPEQDLHNAMTEIMSSEQLKSALSFWEKYGPSQHPVQHSLDTDINAAAKTLGEVLNEACRQRAEPQDEDSKKREKAWRSALHVYLRQKLAFGRRGPASGQTMAVLGYEESCRRLGIQG